MLEKFQRTRAAMSLLSTLQDRTTQFETPFRHWELDQPLTQAMVDEVAATSVMDGPRSYDGTRAADAGGGGLDAVLRCYVTPDNVGDFPALAGLVKELRAPETVEHIGGLIKRDLRQAYLRLEVIVDREGFWLQPHKDIKEKLMSMQLYVNVAGEAQNLGTDIYREVSEGSLELAKTIAYRNNSGYMFSAGTDTWHGLEKKQVRQERRSLLINYVTFKTGWKLPA
ncbi:MAG: hypothetical protein ACI8PT_003148 [Gammaproteobacteria bacterium]|jgi:hypothetical protein